MTADVTVSKYCGVLARYVEFSRAMRRDSASLKTALSERGSSSMAAFSGVLWLSWRFSRRRWCWAECTSCPSPVNVAQNLELRVHDPAPVQLRRHAMRLGQRAAGICRCFWRSWRSWLVKMALGNSIFAFANCGESEHAEQHDAEPTRRGGGVVR